MCECVPFEIVRVCERNTRTEEDINLNLNFYHSQAADYEIYKEKTHTPRPKIMDT